MPILLALENFPPPGGTVKPSTESNEAKGRLPAEGRIPKSNLLWWINAVLKKLAGLSFQTLSLQKSRVVLKNACATITEKWITSFHSSPFCWVNRPIAKSAAMAISESIFIKPFSNCYFMPHWSESILSKWARKSWPCKWQRSCLRITK